MMRVCNLCAGDVQINATAPCLIMTTEILRLMLYNRHDAIRDLEWVIFDEVHYINDVDRGVVWEESIILLPPYVGLVLLSATVPNARELAAWIGHLKGRAVYVVSTLTRPVPLEHHLFVGTGMRSINQLHKIADAQHRVLLEENYKTAKEFKEEKAKKKESLPYGKSGKLAENPTGRLSLNREKTIWIAVIEMLKQREKLPAIAFVFARKRIFELSEEIASVQLTTHQEAHEIHTFFERSIAKLREHDRQLPQIRSMRQLLKNGIGVHHSGVLPLLKEIVEMLVHLYYLFIYSFRQSYNCVARYASAVRKCFSFF